MILFYSGLPIAQQKINSRAPSRVCFFKLNYLINFFCYFQKFYRDLEWSPTDNFLAYWVAEMPDGSSPAKLAVMDVPRCSDLGTFKFYLIIQLFFMVFHFAGARNAFQVVSAKMYWQKSGQRLAMEITRYGKVKRSQQKNEPPVYSQLSYSLEV